MAKKNEAPAVEEIGTETAVETTEVKETQKAAVAKRVSKLTEEQVIEIRKTYHTVPSKKELAEKMGISTMYMYKVARGDAMKGVDFPAAVKPEPKVEAPVETVAAEDGVEEVQA